MMRITPMVKNILLINVGIFLIQYFFKFPLPELFGLRVIFSEDFRPYQFVTYMWIHSGFSHIFYNMLMLFFMAPLLERFWGSKRFLIFYLACGIGAGVLYGAADYFETIDLKKDTEAYLANPDADAFHIFIMEHKSPRYNLPGLVEFSDDFYQKPQDATYQQQAGAIVKQIYEDLTNVPMVGASGALYGILMALFLLFPNTEVLIYFMFPVKLKYIVMILTLTEVYAEFNRATGDNIAHLAHLSGMLIAFVLVKMWQKDRNRFY